MTTSKQKKLPFIWALKNPIEFSKIVKNPAPFFRKVLLDNDGLLRIMMTYRSTIMTDRAEIVRHVLQKNHKNYKKTELVKKVLVPQVGHGLLTSDGEYWLQQRRAIQPGFHKKRLEKISKIMIDEINHYMDDVMDKYAEKNEIIDLGKEMMHLAFKIVSKSLFSGSLNDSDLDTIDTTVTASQQYIVNKVRQPYLRPLMWLNGTSKKIRQLKEESDNVIIQTIRERKASGKKYDDLMDMLLETRYEDTGKGMTETQLKDEAIILYVAGHETSAIALSWAWYLIAKHPEIEKKLLESVQNTLGKNDPKFEDVRNLSYPLQVLEETMRLYPPAWITDRAPIENDAISEEFTLQKGEEIILFIYGVHHNPKYWKNPFQFDPERFSIENKKNHIPFSYLPFGGGPRLCIGNNFALMEMQFVLAQMIRRYKFELVSNQKIDINPLITLRPRQTIKMKISKREN